MNQRQKEVVLNMYNNNPPIYINGTDIIINPLFMTQERLLARFELLNKVKFKMNGVTMRRSDAEQA